MVQRYGTRVRRLAASVRIQRELSQLVIEVSVAGRPDPVVDLEDRIRTLNGQLDLVVGDAATRARLALPIDQRFGRRN